MGCGETLFVGSGGYVTCSLDRCPNPTAMADLMLDHMSPDHIVHVRETTFSILHPMRERLSGELFACPLHEYMMGLDGPPRAVGRYVVRGDAAPFTWGRTT